MSEIIDESGKAKHLILSARIRNELVEMGYDQDDWLQARKLLASSYDGKKSLRELSILQLTEYFAQVKNLKQLKIDAETNNSQDSELLLENSSSGADSI